MNFQPNGNLPAQTQQSHQYVHQIPPPNILFHHSHHVPIVHPQQRLYQSPQTQGRRRRRPNRHDPIASLKNRVMMLEAQSINRGQIYPHPLPNTMYMTRGQTYVEPQTIQYAQTQATTSLPFQLPATTYSPTPTQIIVPSPDPQTGIEAKFRSVEDKEVMDETPPPLPWYRGWFG